MKSDGATLESIEVKLDAILARSDHRWPRWLSVDLASEYTTLSAASIRRLLQSGKLTAHRAVRGKISIDREQLDQLITTSTATPRNGRGRGT